MIWDQLYNIITVILLGAVVIAGVFEDWVELGFISIVIVVNVLIGVVQEGRAEAATKAIMAMTTPTAVALRNGRKVTVDAATLVVGDIVYLTSGDRIPADVRFIEITSIRVVEAALTGESRAVSKSIAPVHIDSQLGDRICMGFMGTLIVAGDAIGLVVATGDNAEIGRINTLMSEVKSKQTPLQAQISAFGSALSILCIIVTIFSFLIAYFARGKDIKESLAIAVGIAVALIPEGLPTVVTITLALGVQTMAKSNAIVRQLPAVETLGAVTCICSDKTGTLTKNEMTVVTVYTSSVILKVTGLGYNPYGNIQLEDNLLVDAQAEAFKQLLLPAALCNDATLMPVVSAKAHQMLSIQPPSLPHLQKSDLFSSVASSASHVAAGPGPEENNAWYITGDPTEAALLSLAMKAGINFRTLYFLSQACPRISCLPFSSENKFMATINDVICTPQGGHRRFLFVKGAADILLPLCSTQAVGLDPSRSEAIQKDHWTAANGRLAQQGMRVLALCQRELPLDVNAIVTLSMITGSQAFQLNCLVAIVDPPREEAIHAVKSCHDAGIVIKMITGDHPATATTIGEWLGISTSEVLTGSQLQAMSDEELLEHVEDCNIFARTSAEHKLRIVRALQARKHIVAMTGDGVNDGPALRQANVGVAMGLGGTEVAKEAARVILQDDNFATLEIAIRLGRTTYDNIRKLIMFILPTSIAQGFSVAVATYIGVATPLTNIQILFVNMITAATLGLVLAAEKSEDGVMARPPRPLRKRLLGKHIIWRSIFVGTLMIVAMLGQFAWSRSIGDSDDVGHTVAMNTLVISQCFYCLSCRFITKSSVSWHALIDNPWLTAFVAVNIVIQFILTYTPGVQDVWETANLDVFDWLRIFLFAFIIFIVVELDKKYGPTLIRPYILPALHCIASCCSPKATDNGDDQWQQSLRPRSQLTHSPTQPTLATSLTVTDNESLPGYPPIGIAAGSPPIIGLESQV